MKLLSCPFCGDETCWPDENSVQMLVYGLDHRANCDASPPESRADAIALLEQARRTGEIPGVTG